MFTGIIQNLGRVTSFTNGELEISTFLNLSDCKIGSSICCNGVCLTATEINSKDDEYTFKVNVGEETQERTNFSNEFFNEFVKINIEKSLKIGDEISGHFVYGHVDCVTPLIKVVNLENSWEDHFKKDFGNQGIKSPFQDGSYCYLIIPGSGSGSSAQAPVIVVVDTENPSKLHKTLVP